jgi:hypothetical protein
MLISDTLYKNGCNQRILLLPVDVYELPSKGAKYFNCNKTKILLSPISIQNGPWALQNSFVDNVSVKRWNILFKSQVMTRYDWRPISVSWCRAPTSSHDQMFVIVWQLLSCLLCGALSVCQSYHNILPIYTSFPGGWLELSVNMWCLEFSYSFWQRISCGKRIRHPPRSSHWWKLDIWRSQSRVHALEKSHGRGNDNSSLHLCCTLLHKLCYLSLHQHDLH